MHYTIALGNLESPDDGWLFAIFSTLQQMTPISQLPQARDDRGEKMPQCHENTIQ